MKIRRFFIVASCLFGYSSAALAQEAVKSINTYGNQVENYANEYPQSNRYFANVARQGKIQWCEFKNQYKRSSPVPYFQQANASLQKGKTVYVYCVSYGVNKDGRWDDFTSYVFRPDGRLSRAWSARIVRKNNVPFVLVVQKWFFNSRGHTIRATRDVFDAKTGTGKLTRLPLARFQEVLVPIYRSVGDLPFYRLLKQSKTKP